MRPEDIHEDDVRDVNEPVDKSKRTAALSALLDQAWDPIGVYEGPVEDRAPAGEYGQYVPALLKLLDRGAKQAEIAWQLREVAHKQMGLPPSGRENDVASLLLRWHALWSA